MYTPSLYGTLSLSYSVAIERLSSCRQLQALILHNNSIDAIHNIECCRQLWHIDLTGNKVMTSVGHAYMYMYMSMQMDCMHDVHVQVCKWYHTEGNFTKKFTVSWIDQLL